MLDRKRKRLGQFTAELTDMRDAGKHAAALPSVVTENVHYLRVGRYALYRWTERGMRLVQEAR